MCLCKCIHCLGSGARGQGVKKLPYVFMKMYTLFGLRGQGAGGYESPVVVYVNVYIVWVQGPGGRGL